MQNTKRNGNSKRNHGTKLKALLGFICWFGLTACATIEDRPMTREEYTNAAAAFSQAAYQFNMLNRPVQSIPAQPRPILIQQNQAQPSYFIQTPPNGW